VLNNRFFLLIAICVFLFCSCSTQTDASDIQVIVRPDSLVMHSEVENIIPFSINLKALNEPIISFQITQRTAKTGLIVLTDSVINTKSFFYNFQYIVPTNIFERKIELSFIAKTASDYSIISRHILLDSTNVALKESSAHVMYSASVLSNNAFSLKEREIISYPLDSTLADIFDFHDTQKEKAILTCEWRTATEKRFARFNDFDYAEATVLSLQSSYANASKKTTVNQLKTNDIILVGDMTKAIAVLKIIAIFDNEGYANDRYVFNMKFVE